MSQASAPARRRGRGLIWLVILIVALPLLWVGYWFASREFVSSAIERATASLAARGTTVACSRQTSGGFPLGLHLDCSEAVFSDHDSGTTVTLPRFVATAPLLSPGHVSTVITGPLTVESPESGASLEAAWHDATIDFYMGLGGLNGATVRAAQLEVTPVQGTERMGFTSLAAGHATMTARPGGGKDYRLSFDASDIALVLRKKKKNIPPFSTTGEFVAHDFGGILGTRPKHAVEEWLAAGGELQVDRFGIVTGETSAEATGRLRVSGEGLVSGELNVRIVGLDQIPAIAARLGLGSKDRLARVVGMASIITRAVPGNPAARDLPVAIRDGVAWVGPIPVGTIPPLRL